jgi:hypothetical protein
MLLQQPLSIKKSLPLLMMHWGQVDVSSVDQRFQGLLSDLSLCALRQTLFFGREDPLCFIPMNDLDLLLRTYLEPFDSSREKVRTVC